MGVSPLKLLDSYEKDAREWGDIIARVDALARAAKLRSESASDPEDYPPFEDGTFNPHFSILLNTGHTPLRCECGDGAAPDAAGLARCSWCGTPSALLRKCARCQKAM